ncbi:phosphoenolpyruvate synthase [Candidatus Woesearchaeota archaeon]|nr:phosphoenolpyruvate synthase [Candidatus Woesearchaeota archaeon]
MDKSKSFILWFNETDISDVPLVGGKNASLGEMYQNLVKKGVRIPNGFSITAYAYRYVLEKSGAFSKLRSALRGLNVRNVRSLSAAGQKCRDIILNCEIPPELRVEIAKAYRKLSKQYKSANVDVAVRSSATAEDLPDASFAGQQETFLNVSGIHNLIDACKRCFASLFTNRAIAYRTEKKFDHFKIALSIGVQKMVRSDVGSAGVAFTIDTESGFKNAVIINGSYGLGESVVQGTVNPDEVIVFKPTLEKKFRPIISKRLGDKATKIIYSHESTKSPVKKVSTPINDRHKFCLDDKDVLELAKWAVIIEDHYSKKRNKWTPMDIEWAKDGKSNKLFIVQARPETVQSIRDRNVLEEYKLQKKGKVLCEGVAVGSKIGQGAARVIKDVKDISNFKQGEILVTEMTDPDWVPIMRIASAIVTNRGGRTCFGGKTKILTDKGIMSFEQLHELHNQGEELLVWSINANTLKAEWKRVECTTKNRLPAIRVACSQTGKIDENWIETTPDHKFFTCDGRALTKKRIDSIISSDEAVNVVDRLPAVETIIDNSVDKLAYLLGAIASDGHVSLMYGMSAPRRGTVTFTQKPTQEKLAFIDRVNQNFQEVFGKMLVPRGKHSLSMIRGRQISGYAMDYRCYSLQAALTFTTLFSELPEFILRLDKVTSLKFLAGLIDGDGTFYNNRLQIYIKKRHVLEAAIVACLKNGIIPQITKNRNIFNLQIVESLQDIMEHTERVKRTAHKKVLGTKLFSAKQILGNIINTVNISGKIKPYVQNNLLIGSAKIDEILAKTGIESEALRKIVNSDLRMYRAKQVADLGRIDVFNIEVEARDELDHNYVVFSERYTPLLVSNSHAAIVSRELGLPCVVGTNDATQKIKSSQKVTVSCSEGEDGRVYEGLLKFVVNKINLKKYAMPKTKVMMNVGNPDQAFELSFLPNEGVGLAREEFIINEYIKIHPLALIHFAKLKDHKAKEEIAKMTVNYKDKKEFFVDKLAQGIGMIAAAFYPKDVILRFSDFKSNEYANLIGGSEFEPKEENPMLGWRGASRYYSPQYKAAFGLECAAIRKVREVFGLTNVKVMIPMCRTVEEGKKVLQVMKEFKLEKGRNGLQVYVMCELPSNVICADEFCKIFDGFSIGSNDLTQMTLGVDRDSALVSHIFDERNEAILRMVEHVIQIAKEKKKKIGICGDAPSSFPEFAEFLVDCGIDSISLSPDAVVGTSQVIAKHEKMRRKSSKK